MNDCDKCKFKKCSKCIFVFLKKPVFIGIIIVILIIIPFIINCLYMKGLTLTEPNTAFTASDMIAFYGSFLSFLGTVVLGILALYQSNKANKISESLIELEKMRESPYLCIEGKSIPFSYDFKRPKFKFDFKNSGSGAAYDFTIASISRTTCNFENGKENYEEICSSSIFVEKYLPAGASVSYYCNLEKTKKISIPSEKAKSYFDSLIAGEGATAKQRAMSGYFFTIEISFKNILGKKEQKTITMTCNKTSLSCIDIDNIFMEEKQ